MSVLLVLGVSTVLLDACDFYVLLTVSIFFFSEIGGVMDSSTTFCFDFPSLINMPLLSSLKTVSVVVTNVSLVSSKYPLVFPTFTLGVSDYLGNGQMVLGDIISVLDLLHTVESILSAWYSPPCYLYNQFQFLIVPPKIKVLLGGGQRLYSKNSTSQGRVLIKRRTWIINSKISSSF